MNDISGCTFSAPVDIKRVPDYLSFVDCTSMLRDSRKSSCHRPEFCQRPMDLGPVQKDSKIDFFYFTSDSRDDNDDDEEVQHN